MCFALSVMTNLDGTGTSYFVIGVGNMATLTVKYKTWGNLDEWANDIPMNFLPYFVYLTSIGAHYRCYFEDHYPEFIKVMELKDSEMLKSFCGEQHTHYYECGH